MNCGDHILVEQAFTEDVAELDRYWERTDTFAYVNQKAAAKVPWLPHFFGTLPPQYRRNHFALLTSGTTGSNKLIIGCKRRAENLARVLHEAQESEPVSETVVALPLTYCYAFVNQWLWSKVMVRTLVLSGGLAQPVRLQEALRNARNAMLCLVGPQAALLGRTFGAAQFPGVIRLHFAGGQFPQADLPRLRALFPNATIFNNYGCTEALPRLTLRRVVDGESATELGPALPGVKLTTGMAGELLFQSRYRCVGYCDEQGFHAIPDEQWLSNGDLVRLDTRGHWHMIGRTGEVFKRYGEKVALPQVLSSVHSQWGGQLGYYCEKDSAGEDGYVLVVSPTPNVDSLRDLVGVFRKLHSRPQWPLRIEAVPVLPLRDNGKLDHRSLQINDERALLWRQRI